MNFNILNPFKNRFQNISIENVLKNSFHFLDKQTIDEINLKTLNFQNADGGFCDRSGKSDLYYSLFGMFVSEALNITQVKENLHKYLESIDIQTNSDGIYMYCLSTLYSKMPGFKKEGLILKKKIRNNLSKNTEKPDYQLFLTLLSFYYQKNYISIFKIIKKHNQNSETDLPCSVLAANAVIMKISGKQTSEIEQKLMNFYRGNGSFSALKNSPVGDLLSTAVALFALKIIGADIRKIKPECLEYIDSMYHQGSFRATSLDFETDIEYTFYGLLALGALA